MKLRQSRQRRCIRRRVVRPEQLNATPGYTSPAPSARRRHRATRWANREVGGRAYQRETPLGVAHTGWHDRLQCRMAAAERPDIERTPSFPRSALSLIQIGSVARERWSNACGCSAFDDTDVKCSHVIRPGESADETRRRNMATEAVEHALVCGTSVRQFQRDATERSTTPSQALMPATPSPALRRGRG